MSRRQKIFADLTDKEVFYGGAAGGGKTDALIISALQYVHVPGYEAIIFRRTRPNLESLIERTHEWFADKADWNGQRCRWTFECPGGGIAKLYLGYMQHENNKFNFKSREFQFAGYDELTEFTFGQYDYLFTRVRRPKCNRHEKHRDDCSTCVRAKLLGAVPLRVRSASNPDGEGREWVKSRFVTDDAAQAIVTGKFSDVYDVRHGSEIVRFVPSRIEDNPGLDQESYSQALEDRDTVTRNRLLLGDWIVRPDGLIKADWLRYFSMQGQIIRLHDANGKHVAACDERECTRFVTIDPAGTSEDRSKEAKGKAHSYSVAGVWDMFPADHGPTLILRHVWRERVDFPGLLNAVRSISREWNPSEIRIENEKLGEAVVAMLHNEMPVTTIATGGKDKVTRAASFLNMLSRGQVFLPVGVCEWRNALEAEWLSWRGLDTDTADQVDIGSYAGMIAKGRTQNSVVLDFDPFGGTEQFLSRY